MLQRPPSVNIHLFGFLSSHRRFCLDSIVEALSYRYRKYVLPLAVRVSSWKRSRTPSLEWVFLCRCL